ncbi:RNA methyltransferase [Candidatus Campbellbacteria bacterium CG11_big_fil_rev_8_21_14_0_20_44_21]|uniref:RNA methyltransferase n=1 Tax=Candidatus Campbellbacteria bacterium CG22_combo_CG10-13_8_21_14_all_43_18 TaxID=1974530 RepID=A0A2H0DXA0_9BACT|nr:MAG: RNA methyltransferase [Candidatus Campbellbacteria bacterium CG22_combo_CG10-13_8_21_14_all_43_18]PIR24218.1 MAG: RNA methyltransferase [Candidatus Campbellbacteria bacterium CG11_big_fil_rev_8_21_14_0_20_44_21]
MKREKVLILFNIRSAHNVGSIFRTADGAGVVKIFLAGFTPAPKDRFNRPRKDIAKVSLGAEKTLSWEKTEDIFTLIKNLKNKGYKIIAVEQDDKSISYKKLKATTKEAFIFGNEVRGLPSKVLRASDFIVEIPLFGAKESLNVAVSAGIILFNK